MFNPIIMGILNITPDSFYDGYENITKETINSYSSVPVDEIDLLIRTGGDKRISNFLLYQIAYAEIMFIEKFWPDFTNKDFVNCLDNFKNVSRRFGKRI